MGGAYYRVVTMRILRAFRRVTMNVRSTGVGVDDVVPNAGSDGAGARSIVRGDGTGYIRACCEFFLEPESQQRSSLKRQNAR